MRVKYITIDPDILLEIFTGGHDAKVVENALPKDSRVVSIGHNNFGQINIVVSSNSFPELEENEVIQQLPHPLFRAAGE